MLNVVFQNFCHIFLWIQKRGSVASVQQTDKVLDIDAHKIIRERAGTLDFIMVSASDSSPRLPVILPPWHNALT
jgi:hypothetical protein